MTFSHINRSTATVLAAAVALGTAGPAAAQIGSNGSVPVSPTQLTHYGKANVLPPFTGTHIVHYGKANVLPPFTGTHIVHYGKANVLPPFTGRHMRALPEMPAPVPAAAAKPVATARPKSGAPGSDVVYVLIGGVVVAIGGLGGILVAASRRRTRRHVPASPPEAGVRHQAPTQGGSR